MFTFPAVLIWCWGEEDICFTSFAGAHQTIDYVTLASIQEAISNLGNTKVGAQMA